MQQRETLRDLPDPVPALVRRLLRLRLVSRGTGSKIFSLRIAAPGPPARANDRRPGGVVARPGAPGPPLTARSPPALGADPQGLAPSQSNIGFIRCGKTCGKIEQTLQKEGSSMTPSHYEQYVDRLQDLGEQILDLVSELRADPPNFGYKDLQQITVKISRR